MMRVLVCGGRHWGEEIDGKPRDLSLRERGILLDFLDDFHRQRTITLLIDGAAKGADRWASHWAAHNHIENQRFAAEWDKFGKSAGFKRNTRMLEEGRPEVVIGFPGGKGTTMMCRIAESAGIEVIKA